MRSQADPHESMSSLQTPEQMVPVDHPLRRTKQLADEALKELSPVFDEMDASTGRRSVPPETRLLGSRSPRPHLGPRAMALRTFGRLY